MAVSTKSDSYSEDEIFQNLRRIRRPKLYLIRYEHFENWYKLDFNDKFRISKRTITITLYYFQK